MKPNFNAMSGPELLAWYNAHAALPVKRFSDRKTAERRCRGLVLSVHVPKDLADKMAAAVYAQPSSTAPTGLAALVSEKRQVNSSESIALSWKQPTVAAARIKKEHVRVDGIEYRSVRAACVALDLPLGQHVRFRGLLKASEGALACPGTSKVFLLLRQRAASTGEGK